MLRADMDVATHLNGELLSQCCDAHVVDGHLIFQSRPTPLQLRVALALLLGLNDRVREKQPPIQLIRDWTSAARTVVGDETVFQWFADHEYIREAHALINSMCGHVLGQVQTLEQQIKNFCASQNIVLSERDLWNLDPVSDKRTVGPLINALKDAHIFRADFQDLLFACLEHRNYFVHSMFIQTHLQHGLSFLISPEVHRSMIDFLLEFEEELAKVGEVFTGLNLTIHPNKVATLTDVHFIARSTQARADAPTSAPRIRGRHQ